MKNKLKPVKLEEEMLETSEFLTITIENFPPSWILSNHKKF
jgi:hypothetical protein